MNINVDEAYSYRIVQYDDTAPYKTRPELGDEAFRNSVRRKDNLNWALMWIEENPQSWHQLKEWMSEYMEPFTDRQKRNFYYYEREHTHKRWLRSLGVPLDLEDMILRILLGSVPEYRHLSVLPKVDE